MDTSLKVVLGGMGGLLGWLALRLYARKYVNDLLWKEYEWSPEVLGPILTSAANGFIVVRSTPEATKGAISLLTEELLPMIGFNIPTEQNIVVFLARKISIPTGIPEEALQPVIKKAIKYGKTETDEQFIKDELNLLLTGIIKHGDK